MRVMMISHELQNLVICSAVPGLSATGNALQRLWKVSLPSPSIKARPVIYLLSLLLSSWQRRSFLRWIFLQPSFLLFTVNALNILEIMPNGTLLERGKRQPAGTG